jgi:hypothetical protein
MTMLSMTMGPSPSLQIRRNTKGTCFDLINQQPYHAELQGQSEFMQDWLSVANDYLELLVQHEGYFRDCLCQNEYGRKGNWRCLDCFRKPLSCTECCHSDHYQYPFHCVKVWCGQYFTPSLLSVVEVVLHLGHGGHGLDVIHPQYDTWVDDLNDSGEDVDYPSLADPTVPLAFNNIFCSLGYGNEQSHRKNHYHAYGNSLITIVDRSGIHCFAIALQHSVAV